MKSGVVTVTFSMYRTCTGMTGLAIRDQYKQWLPYVAHRSDLNYVLGEMVSELNVQHAYIGGDFLIPPRRVALPGARLTLEAASGPLSHQQIFEGENEEDIYRSPLKESASTSMSATMCWQLMARN